LASPLKIRCSNIDHSSADPSQALKLTYNILKLLSASPLTPTSHPYLALSRLYLSLLIASLGGSPENLNEAIRTSARCVSALRDLLPEGHPARGVAMAELGKLLTVDEPPSPETENDSNRGDDKSSDLTFPPSGEARLRLAHDTLRRAMVELDIGFGSDGGEVGANVQRLAREVDKELSIWARGLRNSQRAEGQ